MWRSAPGEWNHPEEVPAERGIPTRIPTTVGATLRAVDSDVADLDQHDWWFGTTVHLPHAISPAVLEFSGVATHWEAFWDGERIASGRSMFRQVAADVVADAGSHQLMIACRALSAVPTPRRPRPPWRSLLVDDQSLRWHRSAGLGRIGWSGTAPAIGPWRNLRLRSASEVGIRSLRTSISTDGDGYVSLALPPGVQLKTARLDGVQLARLADAGLDQATFHSPAPLERWWPHTHGSPRLYDLEITFQDGQTLHRNVGFRTVRADREDGGFALYVNRKRIFVRGAVWTPPDPLRFTGPSDQQRAALRDLADAGANIVRIPGTGTWQDDSFHAACSELGLLVWQDCMLHTLAPPEDAEFLDDLAGEIAENLATAAAYPSLAVVCGGSETEQQPTLWGLPRERFELASLHDAVSQVSEAVAPGIPYLPSTPHGGPLPTSIRVGVSHYFGVGAYRRDLSDARLSGVRFAAECLAFANPPERPFIDRHFGSQRSAMVDSAWLANIARDPGADWDFLEVLQTYTEQFFGIDSRRLRDTDPAYLLDLHRAAATHIFEATFSEWRRTGSSCDGGIVLAARDLAPGAGWGLCDSDGGWKSAMFGAARAWSPLGLLLTDEGLDGVDVHILNDAHEPLSGRLGIEVWTRSGHLAETAEETISIEPGDALARPALDMIGAFRDLTYAWRFGDREYDAIVARLEPPHAPPMRVTHLLGGPHRSRREEVGLAAKVDRVEKSYVQVTVSTRELATFVCLDGEGWQPDRNWFHLAPGGTETVRLAKVPHRALGEIIVRALNSKSGASLQIHS